MSSDTPREGHVERRLPVEYVAARALAVGLTWALVETLTEMGERAEEMLRVAMVSFSRRDLAGAESLVELDELIDRANRRFVERLVDVMAEPELREWGLRMVVVARTIERIGDRAVDIGEQTAYLLTAEFREFTDASHPVG